MKHTDVIHPSGPIARGLLIDAELDEKVKAQAEADGRKWSAMVRILLTEALEARERRSGPQRGSRKARYGRH